ncbi:MAG: hypothetical protein WAV45_11980 [Propionibacteriaceae bacterium]|nr:hypothetical protein [Micropruina sp.]
MFRIPRVALACLATSLLSLSFAAQAEAAPPPGTLTIINKAPAGAGGTFSFGFVPGTTTGQSSVLVAAGATSASLSFNPTNALTISVTPPASYGAFTVSCVANGSATGTQSGTNVTGVKIATGRATTCTFNQTASPITMQATVATPPSQLGETGGTVSYSYQVKNPNPVAVTVTALSDTVIGTLAGSSTCQVGTVIPASGSCNFAATKAFAPAAPGTVVTNTFTATAKTIATASAPGTGTATLIYAALPMVSTALTFAPGYVPSLGGKTVGTYVVTNTSATPETISDLTADGSTLAGSASCTVGTVLAAGAACSFTQLWQFSSNVAAPISQVFSASVNANGFSASATSTGLVTVLFPTGSLSLSVIPSITVIPATGGASYIQLTVTNNRSENVTVAEFVNTWNGITTDYPGCGAGTVLIPGGSCTMNTQIYASGPVGTAIPFQAQVMVSSASGYYVGGGVATFILS